MNELYSGRDIFKLVDTVGLPLEIICMMLREKGMGFNALEFIESAQGAGWKNKRIYNMMMASAIGPDREKIETLLKHLLEDENQSNIQEEPQDV